MLTSLLFQTLGMESVNVVVKVNDLDIFLDTLKKNNYEMVEDYAVVLKENVKCLVWLVLMILLINELLITSEQGHIVYRTVFSR